MSEIPAPYNADSSKTGIERIAHFLNGFLGKELLCDIDIPKHLHKKYENMTTEEMDELFEFAFQEIFNRQRDRANITYRAIAPDQGATALKFERPFGNINTYNACKQWGQWFESLAICSKLLSLVQCTNNTSKLGAYVGWISGCERVS